MALYKGESSVNTQNQAEYGRYQQFLVPSPQRFLCKKCLFITLTEINFFKIQNPPMATAVKLPSEISDYIPVARSRITQ